jgi:hypothetical protein
MEIKMESESRIDQLTREIKELDSNIEVEQAQLDFFVTKKERLSQALKFERNREAVETRREQAAAELQATIKRAQDAYLKVLSDAGLVTIE